MLYKTKAQAILEYTLLLAAIIAVIVVVLFKKEGVATKVKSSYTGLGTAMNNTVNDIAKTMAP